MVKNKKSLVITLAAAMTVIGASTVLAPIEAQAKEIGELCEEQGLDVGGRSADLGVQVARDENGKAITDSLTMTGAAAIAWENGDHDYFRNQNDNSTSAATSNSGTVSVSPNLTQPQVSSSAPAVRYGWVKNQATGKWYYSANGVSWVTSSWQQIGGQWYYFNADGTMAVNQNVGGYWVGADGVWHK